MTSYASASCRSDVITCFSTACSNKTSFHWTS